MASRNMMILSLMLMAFGAVGFSDGDEVNLADDPKSSNAVKMVLKMMEDLDAKIVAEGEQEAKTYKKYSTWCDETKKEKQDDIKDGNAKKSTLESTIKMSEQQRDQFQDSIEKLNKDIAELKKKIADADKARETAAAQHAKTNSETEHAVRAAGQAGDVIKSSNDESPVLELLEKLEGEFRDKDQKADMEEQKAITAYKMLRQQRMQTIAAKQRSLEKAIDDKAARVKTIANAKADLATTKDTLADDTKFLAETEQTCLEKKVTFEQRKDTREEELQALRLATKTMDDVTAGNFTKGKKSSSLLGVATRAAANPMLEVATMASVDPMVLGSAEAEAQAIEEAEDEATGVFSAPLAFFQGVMHRNHYRRFRTHRQHRHRHLRSQLASPTMAAIQTESHHPHLSKQQQALLQFLNDRAASTKSARLVQLARRVATGADPFAEVKELIKGLITKLRAEAKQSQDKKMSCDKKISESSVRRDEAAKKVEELNGDMEEAAARKNRLTEEIAVLKDQMKKMDLEKNKTTKLRNEEKAENTKSISEAQTGLSGVKQAKQILQDFYSKAKKNEVKKVDASANNTSKKQSLLTVEPAPDAGFKNNEANKGSQAASTGIVGMLETIMSDFERTIADTKAEEATAVKDHAKFLADVEASTAAKTKAEKIKKGQLDATTKDLSDDDTALKGQIAALKVAVQELKAHDEECGHGASFEERKAARQREMDALKEAIQFFESTR